MADGNKMNAPTQGEQKASANPVPLQIGQQKLNDPPRPVQAQTIAPAAVTNNYDDPRSLAAKAKPEASPDEGEDLTYLPMSGDPASIKWRGVEFKANVPKRIVDADHIEAARTNRFFRVGKGDPKYEGRNPNDPPATPMQYRAHVVAWIKTCETVEDVVKHWSADRVLRQTCAVGSDDIQWLGSLVEPQLMAFRRKEGLNDAAVANVWIKYGVLDLPWRG